MSASAARRPIFNTASDLGTFRHDNSVIIIIDVEDFDALQSDLEYTIAAGALPSGLQIDVNKGEIHGTLGTQAAVETDYTFTIRARRVVATGVNVYTDKQFTMKVIGDIGIGIAFTTDANLDNITAGVPTLLSIEAVADNTDRVLSYSKTSGSLPTGITLSPTGNLIGTVESPLGQTAPALHPKILKISPNLRDHDS